MRLFLCTAIWLALDHVGVEPGIFDVAILLVAQIAAMTQDAAEIGKGVK